MCSRTRRKASTRSAENRERGRVLATLEPDVGGFIEIAVSDNGKGFPKEDRNRLTEPYVTTRAEGTGLGLPIVVKIFEDHGGGVDLLDGLAARRRRPRGNGVDETAARRRRSRAAPSRRTKKPGTLMAADILIVDDEDDIRELVAGILEDEGHHAARRAEFRRGARGDRVAPAAAHPARHLAAGLAGSTGCSCSKRSSSRIRTFPW